jgi:hypothetical protein
MESHEPSAPLTDVGQLLQAGFTSDEVAGLLRARALYQRGIYHESTPEHRRLEFIRWLYLQGRLQS